MSTRIFLLALSLFAHDVGCRACYVPGDDDPCRERWESPTSPSPAWQEPETCPR